ncbi:MAG: hypothetical protein ACPLYF_04270 [Fervidobacterium sp.]
MEFPKFKTVQIPFTLYDFFGYLLPGITFGALMLLSFDLPNAIQLVTEKVLGHRTDSSPSFLFMDFISLLHKSPWFISLFGLLISYIIGHVIAALSSYFLERIFVQAWLKYPTENMFQLNEKKKKWLFKNFRRSYTSEFVERFKSQFELFFNLPISNSNDTFWITFSFIAHNCPSTFARATHFLNLYGFSRNLSMTFLLSGLVLFIFELIYTQPLQWLIIISYIAISITLYWNYLKLLRRLNDEIYRGFYAFVTSSKYVAAAPNRNKNVK